MESGRLAQLGFIQQIPAALAAEDACAGSGGLSPATPRLARGLESSRAGVSARGEGGACAGWGAVRAKRMRSIRRQCEPSWEMAAAAVEWRV